MINNRVASDQTIEQTMNKHQKSHGNHGRKNSHSRTKDIGKSRINFDKLYVDLLLEVLKEWPNPFEHRESLIHICSCIEASRTVQNDLLHAEKVGLEEMKCFWDERFKSFEKSFYSLLKKTTLRPSLLKGVFLGDF